MERIFEYLQFQSRKMAEIAPARPPHRQKKDSANAGSRSVKPSETRHDPTSRRVLKTLICWLHMRHHPIFKHSTRHDLGFLAKRVVTADRNEDDATKKTNEKNIPTDGLGVWQKQSRVIMK